MTRQPTPGVYENYREPGEFGEGATVRQTPPPVSQMRSVAPTIYVSRNSLDRLLNTEGAHVALQTLIHRKPLRSGNGVALYEHPLAREQNLVGDTPFLFGLEAQGHIPTVEASLAEGADWQEIGRRIGWDGEAAKAYYERYRARQIKPKLPTILHCAVCGADEASTYLGKPGPGIVRCFAVGCDAQVGGYATDEEAIAEWNRRAVAMDAAMTEAYCTGNDDLTDCFRHHITTTIGWLAFGARPGPEMQMYEDGFKAGYRRCQSDNEPEPGEQEDALSARARKLVGKLRESIKAGAVQLADVEDAIDLIIDQSASQDAGTPAYWVRFRVSDGKATFWETEIPDGFPLYRRTSSATTASGTSHE